jgi:hypothetical protein
LKDLFEVLGIDLKMEAIDEQQLEENIDVFEDNRAPADGDASLEESIKYFSPKPVSLFVDLVYFIVMYINIELIPLFSGRHLLDLI